MSIKKWFKRKISKITEQYLIDYMSSNEADDFLTTAVFGKINDMSQSHFGEIENKYAEYRNDIDERVGQYLRGMESELKRKLEGQSAELNNFNPEYSDWYTNEHCGGRKETTIADLKKVIADLPDDMPVKVSHQYDRHPIGIQDPIMNASPVSPMIGVNKHGHPIHGAPDITYFIIE